MKGEDGSTPALSGRDPTWPPLGPSQAQLLKHDARERGNNRGEKYDLICLISNSVNIRIDMCDHLGLGGDSVLMHTDIQWNRTII